MEIDAWLNDELKELNAQFNIVMGQAEAASGLE